LRGEWVPPQLADLLALQRAEEPETAVVLVECVAPSPASETSDSDFDFALAPADLKWPGWVSEPLWHDTLAVGVAKRSHLLAYREVPRQEVLEQPLIYAQSTAGEPWRTAVQNLFGEKPQHEQTVCTFDMAMTLVSAGYGIILAPATRLAGYACKDVVVRPLVGALRVVTAHLVRPCVDLTEQRARFAQRARSVS